MPELPEVQTTVNGLNKTVKGRKIVDVETSYKSPFYKNRDEIKNPEFFKKFKKKIIGQKILKVQRRAKNILIHLLNHETILVHMKMTGHFVYDRPETRFIRLDFKLDNGKHLVLSDMRKFAKVTLVRTAELKKSPHLEDLGPEPLGKNFQFPIFNLQIQKKPKSKIKQVLMDQSLISGIGNIYSDEILWRARVHPLSRPGRIPERNLRVMFKAIKETLRKGIDLGGDSMSDYRNIKGEKGNFQNCHRAYRRTGLSCGKSGRSTLRVSDSKSCSGIIKRIIVGMRSAHFCPKHQKLFK
ncbi:MAG: DNA-formamidopyrimidine glycosylase [bacterium]|nr:DNA-formamidopyrimidine glycosylase [bacterium]MDZ4206048.1 DNA-formamidopyrimidine glycosylase [Patescibacteria group bacterium]